MPNPKAPPPVDESIGRAQGDLIHDNFVPRYSALADASPSLIVLIGVWLLFAVPVVMSPLYIYVMLGAWPFPSAMGALVIAAGICVDAICLAILVKMTYRYFKYRKHTPDG